MIRLMSWIYSKYTTHKSLCTFSAAKHYWTYITLTLWLSVWHRITM